MKLGTLHAVRNRVIVMGACASLVIASLGVSGTAEARVPITADRDDAAFCRTLQDGYDRAIANAAEASSAGDMATYSYWIKVAGAYGDRWNGSSCQSNYGNIFNAQAPIQTSPAVEITTVSDGGSTSGTQPHNTGLTGKKLLPGRRARD